MQAIVPEWVRETDQFAPFGRGNAPPAVAVRGLTASFDSPRGVRLTCGAVGIKAKGRLTLFGAAGRYDVVGTPTVVDEAVVLTVRDVKASVEPSGPDPSVGTTYTPARV